METYEFTCPSCKEKEANKGKKSAKKPAQSTKTVVITQSQTTTNKRDVKAASKQIVAPSNGSQGVKAGSDESAATKGGDIKKSTAKVSAPAISISGDNKSKIVLINKAVAPQIGAPQANGTTLNSKKTNIEISKGGNPSVLI